MTPKNLLQYTLRPLFLLIKVDRVILRLLKGAVIRYNDEKWPLRL